MAMFRRRQNVSFDLTPEMLFPAIFLSILVPLSIWKSEEPSRRSYHWSMPVDRSVHTLAKSTSGWAWLMIAMLTFVLWGLLIALVTGGDLGLRRGQPIAAWVWIHPFVAATIAYLLATIVVLTSDHPWRWFAGIVLGFVLLNAVLQASQLDEIAAALGSVWEGNLGLKTALSGSTEVPREVTLQNGQTLVRTVSQANQQAWLKASALWLGLATAGVLAAAYRHQER
jgi:hypothetical protein